VLVDTILLMGTVKDDAMSDDEATNNNQRIIREAFIAMNYMSFSSQCTRTFLCLEQTVSETIQTLDLGALYV